MASLDPRLADAALLRLAALRAKQHQEQGGDTSRIFKAPGPCAGRWHIVPAVVTPCQCRRCDLHF